MPLAVVLLTFFGISLFDGNQFDGNGKTPNAGNIYGNGKTPNAGLVSAVLGHGGNFVDGRGVLGFSAVKPSAETGNTKFAGIPRLLDMWVPHNKRAGSRFSFHHIEIEQSHANNKHRGKWKQ